MTTAPATIPALPAALKEAGRVLIQAEDAAKAAWDIAKAAELTAEITQALADNAMKAARKAEALKDTAESAYQLVWNDAKASGLYGL